MLKRAAAVTVAAVMTMMAGAPAAYGQAAGGDAEARELAAYRLTKAGLDKMMVATRTMAAELQKDPKFQEMARVERDVKALESRDELTDAEQARLEALQAKKEALSESMNVSMGDAKTLTEMEAQLRRFPPLMAGLQAAGMTPREYAKFTLTLVGAAFAAGMKKAGLLKELPKEVSAENVAFVEEHEAALKAMQKEWESLAPKGGGEPSPVW